MVYTKKTKRKGFEHPVLKSKPQRWIPELRFGYPPLRNSFWEKLRTFLESFGWSLGAKKSTVQSFSATLRVMDVRAQNRGRPRQKVRFPAAPVAGRNFLTPGHPGVRVRNVPGKSGPKSLWLCCFFFPARRGTHRKKPEIAGGLPASRIKNARVKAWKRGKGPHPCTFSFTQPTARFTKGRFRPLRRNPNGLTKGNFMVKLTGRGFWNYFGNFAQQKGDANILEGGAR